MGLLVILDTGCRSSRIQMSVCVVMMGIWVPLYEELIKLQHQAGRDVLGIVLKSGTGRDVVVVEGDVSRGHMEEGVSETGHVFLIDVCCPWGLHVDVH